MGMVKYTNYRCATMSFALNSSRAVRTGTRILADELIDLLAVHNLYRRRGIFMCKFGGSGLARDSLGQWG